MTDVLDRLVRQTEFDDCWTWTGYVDRGYGKIGVGGRRGRVRRVHRLGWELLVGPVPDDLTLDHLCRNRACWNPDHLEPVTAEENNRRGVQAKTHCIHGHEYTEENTYRRPDGTRLCRVCMRTHANAHYRRTKA